MRRRVSSSLANAMVALLLTTPRPVVGLLLSSDTHRWLREAELKHGRVAMLAIPTLALLASDPTTSQAPVDWLNAQPASTQLTFYAVAATLEAANLRRFESAPSPLPWRLKDDATPGQLLRAGRRRSPSVVDDVEVAIGRAAMLVAASVLTAAAAT